VRIVGYEHHRREPLGVRLEGLGERRELPQRPGGAPAASDFFYIQIKSELMFGHRCVNTRLQRWGKSGQIRDTKPKTGQMDVPEELWFFPGHIVKNRDCPGKSGKRGHLSLKWVLSKWKSVCIVGLCSIGLLRPHSHWLRGSNIHFISPIHGNAPWFIGWFRRCAVLIVYLLSCLLFASLWTGPFRFQTGGRNGRSNQVLSTTAWIVSFELLSFCFYFFFLFLRFCAVR